MLINKNFVNLISLFLLIFITLQSSCFVSKNSGVVVFKPVFYNPDSNKYLYQELVSPSFKAFYKDSAVIFKIVGLSINSSDGIETSRKTVLMYYTYIDLNKRAFYKYMSFSDTAKIIESYNREESSARFFGPRFYEKRSMSYIKPIEHLPDTIVNMQLYKRVRITEKIPGDTLNITTSVAYFDCSKKGSLFQLNMSLSEKIGCPMVGYYICPTAKYPAPPGSVLEFTNERLTKFELKVFNAWEQNAKKYPVKQ